MTKQRTFNKVVRHLLTQNKKSTRRVTECGERVTMCLYRGPGGLKCAAGCLIPDDKYDPNMEGLAVLDSDSSNSATRVVIQQGHNADLVNRLQVVHDSYRPAQWPAMLRDVAICMGLRDDVIAETLEKLGRVRKIPN